jgi:hypothetical protein
MIRRAARQYRLFVRCLRNSIRARGRDPSQVPDDSVSRDRSGSLGTIAIATTLSATLFICGA